MNGNKSDRTCLVVLGLVLGVLGFEAGCGYVGDPLYPALNIPGPVTDLTAVQRGSNIAVSFTIPPLTTEGLVFNRIGGVDLRIGPNQSNPFSTEQWASSAARIQVPAPEKPGTVRFNVPVGTFSGQDVILAVRALNSKGRPAQWSNFAVLSVKPPLVTPSALTAETW